jgi:hypothetical protein
MQLRISLNLHLSDASLTFAGRFRRKPRMLGRYILAKCGIYPWMNDAASETDEPMDRAKWSIVLISGMGFFTDAYDLFIIGVVIQMLVHTWHITPFDSALLGAVALGSAALGSAIFGRISDIKGRKYIYGRGGSD